MRRLKTLIISTVIKLAMKNGVKMKKTKTGYQFKSNKGTYAIPSKEFPLSCKGKDDIGVFSSENTEVVTDKDVQRIFDNYKYRTGKCYYNARDLKSALEKNNIHGWDFYSGWFFIPNMLPVHHAWLVKDDKYVLDYTNNMFSEKMMDILINKDGLTKDEIRMKMAQNMELLDKVSSSTNKICGKVHEKYIFIGSKDTFTNSLKIFKGLANNHIAYRFEGMSQTGLSKIQRKMNKGNVHK